MPRVLCYKTDWRAIDIGAVASDSSDSQDSHDKTLLSEKASIAYMRGLMQFVATPQENGSKRVLVTLDFSRMILPDKPDVIALMQEAQKIMYPIDSDVPGRQIRKPSVTRVSFGPSRIADNVLCDILLGLRQQPYMEYVSFDGLHIGERSLRVLIKIIGEKDERLDKMRKIAQEKYRQNGFHNLHMSSWRRAVGFSFKNVTFSDPNGMRKIFSALAQRLYIPQFYADETDCSQAAKEDMEKVMAALRAKPPDARRLEGDCEELPQCDCSFNGSRLTKELSCIVSAWLAKCSATQIALYGCDVRASEIYLSLIDAAAHCRDSDKIYLSDDILQGILRKQCRRRAARQEMIDSPAAHSVARYYRKHKFSLTRHPLICSPAY